MKTSLNIFLLFLILCASCGSRKANDHKETAVQADTVRKFTLPLIPAMLNTPELRADYLVRHYWDNMDFTDTTYINLPDVTEQAWVDFIDILKIVPDTTAIAAIKQMYKMADQKKVVFFYYTDLAEKYLYDPNSPMRNEEFYIPVLDAMLESKVLNDTEKILPQGRRELAEQNRIGRPAEDFTYTLLSGKNGTLYGVKAKYTLLFINNPGCHACEEGIEALKQAPAINKEFAAGSLKILAIYPDEDKEEWYFSVVDVIRVLTGSENPRRYWSDLKRKLKAEGAVELYEKIVQFKMTAPDGKMRLTDVANTEQLLRIMQSVPSPKAEPIRAWLAEVGRERIEETIDPEQAIDRALETYLKKGYDPDWVHQRLLSIRIRNELTDEWQKRGVEKGREFAILTDEISRAWSGMTTRQYKNLKGLKKENLRDNMSDTELVLTMLAEASTRDISKASKPVGFDESVKVAKRGGKVANGARQQLEAETGQPVITSQNAAQLNAVVTEMIEASAQVVDRQDDSKSK